MKGYNNTILLLDYNDNKVDAIIYTNEDEDVIQDAIRKATDEWYEQDYPDCQLNYVLEYLDKHYDIAYTDAYADEINKVYY